MSMDKSRAYDSHRPDGKPMSCSISFRIEAETVKALEEISSRNGVSKSFLIKKLIRDFVSEEKQRYE